MDNNLPPGRYYVGDLCYFFTTLDKWIDFLENGHKWNDGIGEYEGLPFSMFSTAWGDGAYVGSDNNNYPVDSGTIGCIKVADDFALGTYDDGLGQVIEFTKPFTCESINGLICFGDLSIETDPDPEEEEDDYFSGENEDDV